jgi:hypothetical protein
VGSGGFRGPESFSEKVFGGSWCILVRSDGGLWWFQRPEPFSEKVSGGFWCILAHPGGFRWFQKVRNRLRKGFLWFLVVSGAFWCVLVGSGGFWWFLVHSGEFWWVLAFRCVLECSDVF